MASILSLPSLNSFAMYRFQNLGAFDDWSVQDGSCALEHVKISSDIGGMYAVALIVSAAKHPKSFSHDGTDDSYRTASLGATGSFITPKPCSVLGDALRKHSRSLETLSLPIIPSDYSAAWLAYGTPGSLVDCLELKEIERPITTLVDLASGCCEGSKVLSPIERVLIFFGRDSEDPYIDRYPYVLDSL
ncbi:hypothetical protein NX059_003601 [Plenodomus lindquistii]|nr:hypothetical protein NX059_003601 [Plenodomus lindquistii]